MKYFGVLLAAFFVMSTIGSIGAHEERGKTVIHMTSNGFEPALIEINQGETVIFENADTMNRWPASDIHPTHSIYPAFDSKGGVGPGEEWEMTFTEAGTWTMHDHLIPEFTGEIVVKAVDGFVGEEKEEEKEPILKRLKDFFKVSASKIYYKLFSSKLESALANTNMMQTALEEEEIRYWLQVAGPEKVMSDILLETDNGAARDCHTEAHKIGHQAYNLYGAEAFEKGDPSCHSGFYHGAMESFIIERGTENFAQEIAELCEIFPTTYGKFECLHGVGHGVMGYKSYNLLAALDACGELPDAWSARSCYGGAYMENVMAGLGLGANPDHTTKWVSNDPHFPCNAIYEEREEWDMRDECYLMQTSWMLKLTNYDFNIVAKQCMDTPAEHRSTCFRSYGRDAAGHTLRDPQKIAALCKYVPTQEKYLSDCMIGAVNVIIEFWGEKYTNQADPVCDLFPAQKSLCEEHIKTRKRDLVAA